MSLRAPGGRGWTLLIALLVVSAALRWTAPEQVPGVATPAASAAFLTFLVGNYSGGELVYGMGMRVRTAEREERGERGET